MEVQVGSSGVGSRVRTSTRNAGDVVQHLVSASFDVLFEESGDAGMFLSTEDAAGTAPMKLGERKSHSSLCGKHGDKGLCTVLDCAARARADGLCAEPADTGVCTLPVCSTDARANGGRVKHGSNTRSAHEHPGCSTDTQASGLYVKHEGRGMCTMSGCSRKAVG